MNKMNKKEYENLKEISGIRDYKGRKVEMISVDKQGNIRWHWSDGAMTPEHFTRGLFFDSMYFIIKTLRKGYFKLLFYIIIFLLIFYYIFYYVFL